MSPDLDFGSATSFGVQWTTVHPEDYDWFEQKMDRTPSGAQTQKLFFEMTAGLQRVEAPLATAIRNSLQEANSNTNSLIGRVFATYNLNQRIQKAISDAAKSSQINNFRQVQVRWPSRLATDKTLQEFDRWLSRCTTIEVGAQDTGTRPAQGSTSSDSGTTGLVQKPEDDWDVKTLCEHGT
jgi:hypothetical protein